MPIEIRPSILPDSEDPIADADVIQTANLIGYVFGRISRGQKVRFDSEGDSLYLPAPHSDDARRAWRAARLDEYTELLLLRELGYKVDKIFKAIVPTVGNAYGGLAPFKDDHPAIVGQAGEHADGTVHDWHSMVQARAKQFCRAKGDGPYPEGLGYRGQGSYTGVVVWAEEDLTGDFPHFCTTRRAFKDRHDHVTRWHPDDDHRRIGNLPTIGIGDDYRLHGMQATNKKQAKIQNEQYMYFTGDDPEAGDVIGYNHGLPLAIVELRSSHRVGTPVEVVGASNHPEWADLTRKASSCFQCAVYMEANNFPTTSVHLGRGESWVPPYPTDYDQRDEARVMAAEWTLSQYYYLCDAHLRNGADLLRKTNAIKSERHERSLRCLEVFLQDNRGPTRAQRSAEAILDAAAVLDKDYNRMLRALWEPGDKQLEYLIEDCKTMARDFMTDDFIAPPR